MHIPMSGNSGKHLQLLAGNLQIICHTLCRCIHIQTSAQGFILCGNARRARTAAADTVVLAACRNQGTACHCNGIRTHGKCLGKVR